MPRISAILHTHNDARRLGRALETLRPCDEILIVDSGSSDDTLAIARQYAARVILPPEEAASALTPLALILAYASHDWLLFLSAREALSELLEAELYEWRLSDPNAPAFAMPVREQLAEDTWQVRAPEARLLHRECFVEQPGQADAGFLALPLQGAILRFHFP